MSKTKHEKRTTFVPPPPPPRLPPPPSSAASSVPPSMRDPMWTTILVACAKTPCSFADLVVRARIHFGANVSEEAVRSLITHMENEGIIRRVGEKAPWHWRDAARFLKERATRDEYVRRLEVKVSELHLKVEQLSAELKAHEDWNSCVLKTVDELA